MYNKSGMYNNMYNKSGDCHYSCHMGNHQIFKSFIQNSRKIMYIITNFKITIFHFIL